MIKEVNYPKKINEDTVERGSRILEELNICALEIDKLEILSEKTSRLKNKELEQAIANYITLRLATIIEVFRFAVIAKIIEKYQINIRYLIDTDVTISQRVLSHLFDSNIKREKIIAYIIGKSSNHIWDEPFNKLLGINYVDNNYFFQVLENTKYKDSKTDLREKFEELMIERNNISHQMTDAKIGKKLLKEFDFKKILGLILAGLMIGMSIKKGLKVDEKIKTLCEKCGTEYEKLNSELEKLLNYDVKHENDKIKSLEKQIKELTDEINKLKKGK